MSAITDSQHIEIAELLPDFSIGALNDGDLWRVEAHLATCPDCQEHFSRLLDLVGTLSPQVTPSRSTKLKLFETAGLPLPLPVQPISTKVSRKRELLRFPVRPVQIGLVAAVLALIVLGAWSFQLQQDLNENESIFALINDPGAAHPLTDSEIDTTASATLYTNPERDQALLVAQDLPELLDGEVFRVWLFTETGERIDGGNFTPDENGSIQEVIDAPMAFSTYWAVGITVESGVNGETPSTPLVLGGWIQ